MGRRSKNPKSRTLCLRLTDKQLHVLQAYTNAKGLDTEVDALRHIIDGLETWLRNRAQEDPEPAMDVESVMDAVGNSSIAG